MLLSILRIVTRFFIKHYVLSLNYFLLLSYIAITQVVSEPSLSESLAADWHIKYFKEWQPQSTISSINILLSFPAIHAIKTQACLRLLNISFHLYHSSKLRDDKFHVILLFQSQIEIYCRLY